MAKKLAVVLMFCVVGAGCRHSDPVTDRRFDKESEQERQKIAAFKMTADYAKARQQVIAYAEADNGRVLWCDCVYYDEETKHEILRPEVFIFRVFVSNDGTYVQSVPEMTTLIGWLPTKKQVHGYYSDIFPHPWDSNLIDKNALLSESAKEKIKKREDQLYGSP